MTYRQWLLRCLAGGWKCGIAIAMVAGLFLATEALAGQTVHTYDAQNRLIRTDYPDGSSTTFTYNAVGRLTQITDSISGTIELSYDNLDRLIQETTALGTIRYTYDAIGRRASMTINGGQPITYQYDAASRLMQVAQGSQIVTIGYDAANRRTSLTYPNGTSTSYTYDAASRITTIIHSGPGGLIESLSYTHDAGGNRIAATRTSGAATLLPAAMQATYDAANQQAQFNSATPNLTYDGNGNLTSVTDAGNTTSYTWDARDRLTGITGPGVTASFSYDALGRRMSKTVNGVTTQYLYDGKDIVAEIQGGAITVIYLRGLRPDDPFVRISSSGNEYYHGDAQGSIVALTNQAGAVVATYTYEPFGKSMSTGLSTNPFQYTGRENDGAGLYFYRARYYSPTHERFISEDPILAPMNPLAKGLCRLTNGTVWMLPGMVRNPDAAPPQRLNPYVYVRNSPTNYSDPSGLIDKRPCGPQIDQCISQTRGTPLGNCLGTAYGLYFGGDTSNCKKGIFTRKCLGEDQSQVIANCSGQGPFPEPCTNGVGKCIDNDPSFK